MEKKFKLPDLTPEETIVWAESALRPRERNLPLLREFEELLRGQYSWIMGDNNSPAKRKRESELERTYRDVFCAICDAEEDEQEAKGQNDYVHTVRLMETAAEVGGAILRHAEKQPGDAWKKKMERVQLILEDWHEMLESEAETKTPLTPHVQAVMEIILQAWGKVERLLAPRILPKKVPQRPEQRSQPRGRRRQDPRGE